jgi:hypothetical protein
MITESTLLVLTGWRPEFGITIFSANRWQRYTRPAGPGQATMKAGGLEGVLPKDSERGPCRCGARLCPPRTSRSTVRHCKGAGLVPRRGDNAGAQRLVLRTSAVQLTGSRHLELRVSVIDLAEG